MNHDPHLPSWWPPHMRPLRLRISKPWAVGLGAVFLSGVAVVLLLLLTLSTHHRSFDDSHFQRLVLINGAVALVLLLLIGLLLWPWCRAGAVSGLAAACWSSWRPSLRWWACCQGC